MELVPRTTAPSHATGAVEFVPLSAVSADATFRLRDEGDVSALAGSIVRLGQLVPIELRPLPGAGDGPARYQVVAGFRRLAALRILQRGRVLARLHQRLDDDDAWGLALVQALLGEPLTEAALAAVRARLATLRQTWADDLVDEARVRAPVEPEQRERFLDFLSGAPAPVVVADAEEPDSAEVAAPESDPEPAPEDGPEEVTPEQLTQELAERLWALNQDLAFAWDAWDELPEEGRRLIIEQARYVAELYPLLTGGRP